MSGLAELLTDADRGIESHGGTEDGEGEEATNPQEEDEEEGLAREDRRGVGNLVELIGDEESGEAEARDESGDTKDDLPRLFIEFHAHPSSDVASNEGEEDEHQDEGEDEATTVGGRQDTVEGDDEGGKGHTEDLNTRSDDDDQPVDVGRRAKGVEADTLPSNFFFSSFFAFESLENSVVLGEVTTERADQEHQSEERHGKDDRDGEDDGGPVNTVGGVSEGCVEVAIPARSPLDVGFFGPGDGVSPADLATRLGLFDGQGFRDAVLDIDVISASLGSPVDGHGAGSETDNHVLIFTFIRDVVLETEVKVVVDEGALAGALLANTKSVAAEEFVLLSLGKVNALAEVDKRAVVENGEVVDGEVSTVVSFDELFKDLELLRGNLFITFALQSFALLIF